MTEKRQLTETEAFRAQELLLQRATDGLDDHEAAELAALGVEHDVSFDLAAAAIDLATLEVEAMPAGVADKVLVAAGVPLQRASQLPSTLAGVAPPRPISTTTPPPAEPAPAPADPGVIPIDRVRKRPRINVAVVAAAASIAIAAGAVLWATQRPPKEVTKIVEVPVEPPPKPLPTPAEARAQLLASAGDVTTYAWTATQDPNAIGASGDVVWSPSAQTGYMRFVGLTPNDRAQVQYQLWIFDKHRDQAFPVDGGVFDISSTGEVIVPISAKLKVDEPVLFAVTVEQPGGVVVSKRERIVVTAAPT